MAKKSNWSDDYWLLIMQIYLYKPVGVKPLYNRMMVNLGIELHIHPSVLHEKMQQLANLDTPRIERLWNAYSGNPQKLSRAVKLLREMNGFHDAGAFYNLAVILNKKGKNNEAIQLIRRSLNAVEKDTPGYKNLSDMLDRLSKR